MDESNGLMFLNPADWRERALRREEAGPERLALAKRATLHKRNWRTPSNMLGG
jgi:hypothetical protein